MPIDEDHIFLPRSIDDRGRRVDRSMGSSAIKKMATMIHRFVLLITLLQQRSIYSYAISSSQTPGASTLAPTKIKLTYFDFEGKGEPV